MPGPGDRGGVKQKPKNAKGALLRIIGYLMKYRFIVLFLLLCSFASNIGNLMGPNFAVDQLMGKRPTDDSAQPH